MFRILSQAAISVIALLLGSHGIFAGDMADYKELRTYRQAPSHECDADDVGSVQVSCRYIEVGSIDGYQLGREKKERDPRWAGLKKYQLGSETRIKFAGLACARGKTETEAAGLALGRASRALKDMLQEWEDKTFTEQLTGLGFNKYDDGYNCKRTPNTSGEDELSASNGATQPDPTQQAADEEALRQEQQRRVAERDARQQAEAKKRRATFIITNSDRYTLGLAFYSKSRGGEWPGGGKQYVLSGTETYNLKCTPGEKICYGAWRDHQTIYWGVGKKGRQGCQGCCIQCGQTLEMNLTDGGPDSYPQTSSGGDVLGNVIGAIGLGAAIYNGLNGGGYSSPVAPPPRRHGGNESTISGLD